VNPIRVAVVDDSVFFVRALCECLEQWPGFEVVGCAADADGGLVLIEEQRPDLVLLDIVMPGKNGLDALRQIRRHGRLPRIVLMTALSRHAFLQLGMEAGADAVIGKGDLYGEIPALAELWFRAPAAVPAEVGLRT
jgi:two-component system response regulator CpxR